MLRDYQQKTIDMLYEWMRAGNKGNPCLNLPTGAGKSHIVAALCKDALQNWPETKILMLTHQKELIEQNAEKLRQHWKGAPLGIYSASVGKKELGEPITFAGIQSIRNKSEDVGFIDLVIVDECHTISHKAEGGYRTFLSELKLINPKIRIIGLTATPYRLGHGLITDKPAIFDDILEPVSIEELIHKGFLAPLKSKVTQQKLDTSNVKKRGGEYIESELQKAVDNDPINSAIIDEVISVAGDRKAWLFFCTGVDHSEHIKEALISKGITAECVTGKTPKKKREDILRRFKSGEIRALTNANVLTTGFDYPDIDMVAMLRPTMSPALYVQMAGRGLRPKSHTDHCLVLDFAGAVKQHGPITCVQPPSKEGKGGEAPVKACPECFEIVHSAVRVCAECGYIFELNEKDKAVPKLHSDDIMGLNPLKMEISEWQWIRHVSRSSGKEMLKVRFYGGLSDKPVDEYLTVTHQGFAGSRAREKLKQYIDKSEAGEDMYKLSSLDDMAERLNKAAPPSELHYRKNGKFYDIVKRSWKNA